MSVAYQEMIIADTRCTPIDAIVVENIMREDIFHATLDWQSRDQLREGAIAAYQLLEEARPEYEQYYRATFAAFEDSRKKESIGA